MVCWSNEVVEIAGRIPMLVRGGGKAPDKEILERTEKLIQQGAASIVYGRNIIQHSDPAGMTRALMAIVHDGATAKPAAKFIKGLTMKAEGERSRAIVAADVRRL